jgi:hypothetical protein
MFFDPPYGVEDRAIVYDQDSRTVARDVEEWCLERGRHTDYKIVIAGYENEYKSLVEDGWKTEGWRAQGGYSNLGTRNNTNRHRETLFFSPHCSGQMDLFSWGGHSM